MPDSPARNPDLLGPDEAPPLRVLAGASSVPLLLVCDHASRRLPRALGGLGVAPSVRRSHLAQDIGAGALTWRLSRELGATAVLAGYSRLAVDLNRSLDDPQAFLVAGDGQEIPGNRDLAGWQRERRAQALYWPYHGAVAGQLQRLARQGRRAPALISMHSFTPVFEGRPRPWEISVLWKQDQATAEYFLVTLRAAGFVVGDNVPYSGSWPKGFTIGHHAEAAGLPHVTLEVRQDLLAARGGIQRFARPLRRILADLALVSDS